MSHHPGSRARLNRHSLPRFTDDSLFCHVARVVCEAECLPRKELYESWEFARRVRRRLRGGRVVDLAAGHGLVAMLMLLLDDSSPRAIVVDRRIPESATILLRAFEAEWPRLRARIDFHPGSLEEVALASEDQVVSAHACGPLTDQVIDRAVAASVNVAVLPCCQAEAKSDNGGLRGWLDPALAIDVTRAARLRAAGYQIFTQTIPATITPKNRLLIGLAPAKAEIPVGASGPVRAVATNPD